MIGKKCFQWQQFGQGNCTCEKFKRIYRKLEITESIEVVVR